MTTPHPNAWTSFWQSVFRYQKEKVNPWIGLRNAAGVLITLGAGAAAGNISAGVAATTGALNVAFRDSTAPYAQRARQMIAGSFIAGIAVFVGSVTGHNDLLALAIAGLWAFAAGMLVSISDASADLGAMSVVILVIYAANSMHPQRAALAGLTALAGGLLQTGLTVAMWPFGRYNPERRVLSDLYAELARIAEKPPTDATQSVPATASSLQAQTMLASLESDRSVEGDRYRFLLAQAERIRVSLLALSRIRLRLSREDAPPAEAIALIDRCFEITSAALRSAGNELREPGTNHATDLKGLEEIADQLRNPTGTEQARAALKDARVQIDALAGQLRAAIDVVEENSPAAIPAAKEAARPWRLRVGGNLATLAANLNFRSTAFRHALRLAACVVIGDAFGRAMGYPRPYWIPMTVAIVLKPDFSATFQRGILRLGGTYAGLIIATFLFRELPGTVWPHIFAVAALMFLARCFGPANYGIVTISISALVVFLFSLSGISAREVVAARALNTSIGGAIALLAYWLWPTWERELVAETAARMLDAFRNYFEAVCHYYVNRSPRARLDETRVAGRLARSNMEASINRASSEPGVSAESIELLRAMLASSRRLAQSLMSLEAASALPGRAPARSGFEPFARDVNITLERLAKALRGSAVDFDALPDLREDHHALIHSGDLPAERYTLANIETDRITNSLNTLASEVRRWVELQGPR